MAQVVTLTCRRCGNVVEKSENTSSRIPASMDIEDIAAIDTWLSTAAPSFERVEDDRKVVWKRLSRWLAAKGRI